MKLALPKGRLQRDTASLLQTAGLGLERYDESSRSYHLASSSLPGLSLRVFQERDIPIQVASGNYDLGICGLDWVAELMTRYPCDDLVTLRSLGYGESSLHVVTSRRSAVRSTADINGSFELVRIVSEYPNLAETFALRQRLRRFSILPIVGGGEVYPPESADLAMISEASVGSFDRYGLVPLHHVLSSTACLIANRRGLAEADLSQLLEALLPIDSTAQRRARPKATAAHATDSADARQSADGVRIALPDGHLSQAAAELFERAGLKLEGYTGKGATRRPTAEMPGVTAKVIRPQDMPLQVANDNFDLAITGEDWLSDHLCRFPASPVKKLLRLGFGAVRVVAVVSEDSHISNAAELSDMVRRGQLPHIRVASEYVNIADRYACDKRLERYKIIPTWGASEAFVPDDADVLIENTETGRTLAKHRLRIIDTIMQSTACLIGHRGATAHPQKKDTIDSIIANLKKGRSQ